MTSNLLKSMLATKIFEKILVVLLSSLADCATEIQFGREKAELANAPTNH